MSKIGETIPWVNVFAMENGLYDIYFHCSEAVMFDSASPPIPRPPPHLFSFWCYMRLSGKDVRTPCVFVFFYICEWRTNTLFSDSLTYVNLGAPDWSSKWRSSHWAVAMTVIFQLQPSWMRRVWPMCLHPITEINERWYVSSDEI